MMGHLMNILLLLLNVASLKTSQTPIQSKVSILRIGETAHIDCDLDKNPEEEGFTLDIVELIRLIYESWQDKFIEELHWRRYFNGEGSL